MTLTEPQCRALRRAHKAGAKVRVPTEFGGHRLLVWKNINHPSAQLYIEAISRNPAGNLESANYIITQKCEFKRLGFTRTLASSAAIWTEHWGEIV